MLLRLTEDGLNAKHKQADENIQLHDRVHEAYVGNLGNSFRDKTRKRLDWVVSQVIGKNVLDVGCSQGTVSLLLATNKVYTTGIDIDQVVIDNANKNVSLEPAAKKYVNFITEDFVKHETENLYDTVILTEVLEHLYDPELFISQAFKLTKVGGKIVVTVPFGINDHPDHRQNFYLVELYGVLSKYYELGNVEIIEKWIGFSGNRRSKKLSSPEIPPYDLLTKSEAAFYNIERQLVDKSNARYDNIQELENVREDLLKLREYTRNLWRRAEKLEQKNDKLKSSFSYRVGSKITYVPMKLYARPKINKLVRGMYYSVLPGRRNVFTNGRLKYSDISRVPKPRRKYILNRTITSNKPLRMASIMDNFTYESFKHEADISQLTPENWRAEITQSSPDLLFVESAWRGVDGAWTNKIAKTPHELCEIVKYCRDNSIPTIFWNKEDPVHIAHFMKTASLFDYVFTTDADSIPIYRDILGHNRVYLLPFAAQPAYNNPIEKYVRKDKFNFAGSYYLDYKERCRNFDAIMNAVSSFKPVDIFDRNYGKDLPVKYQYPDKYSSLVRGSLQYSEIDKAYKGYTYAVTMNTIKYSSTMFARRAFELLASNTITVGNYSKGMKYFLGDLTTSSDNEDAIVDSLNTIIESPNLGKEKYRLLGLRRVISQHTYEERLDRVLNKVFSDFKGTKKNKTVAVVSLISTQKQLKTALENYNRQDYKDKKLILILTKKDIKIDVNFTKKYSVVRSNEIGSINMKKLLGNTTYVSVFDPKAFYGKYYITDVVLATLYCDVDVIGKAAYFMKDTKKPTLKYTKNIYREGSSIEISRCLLKQAFLGESVAKLVNDIENKKTYKKSTLSIDGFNYCDSSNLTEDDMHHIEGSLDIDLGADIQSIYSAADAISDSKLAWAKARFRIMLGQRRTHLLNNNPKEIKR